MTDTQPRLGFFAQIKSFPSQFWVVNTMEIFERLSWYGWFTVMALYVTAPVATGGLGFTTETRGVLQAIVPFILYLLPVLTGALADRFGFKRMFIIAYVVMIISYYMLGQFKTFPTFFTVFLFVAIGAAIFKPVVVGTVARVTNESNSSMGFGIFYMMVNVGGFVGPIVAGVVRGWEWKWVFVACSFWAFVNLLIVILLYRNPPAPQGAQDKPKRSVIDSAVEVLGNGRFFITVGAILVALMLAGLGYPWFTWMHCLYFVIGWLVLNFLYDRLLPAGNGRPAGAGAPRRFWLARRMHCSNWRFALFLLIMSGFWTSFNQIFYTMPEYIRDFTETRPLINTFDAIFGAGDGQDPTTGASAVVATISDAERGEITRTIQVLADAHATGTLDNATLEDGVHRLLATKVRLLPDDLRALVEDGQADVEAITDRAIIRGRQFNPEFIININAGSIVLFQIFVSFLMARFHRFTTMIVGMVVAGVGIAFSAFADAHGFLGIGASIWIVCIGLLTFSFGEMMASPTSQEYVGRIAPEDKKALYMGYYFVSIALGNLFGGILSGQLYGALARDMQRPDLMWMAFGAITLVTAVIFLLYNKFALPKSAAHTLTGNNNA